MDGGVSTNLNPALLDVFHSVATLEGIPLVLEWTTSSTGSFHQVAYLLLSVPLVGQQSYSLVSVFCLLTLDKYHSDDDLTWHKNYASHQKSDLLLWQKLVVNRSFATVYILIDTQNIQRKFA